MNYKFLTYLFSIGATLEFFGGWVFLISGKPFLGLFAFVLLANSGIHATLVRLFSQMADKKKPTLVELSLTIFNIFSINANVWVIYFVITNLL